MPDRVRFIHDQVASGGALMMVDGYYSLQGIIGGAHEHDMPVGRVSPVRYLAWRNPVEMGAHSLYARSGHAKTHSCP